MQLVNFFMVAATFAIAAYATLLDSGGNTIAALVSLSGLMICFAFERLDARTRKLVQLAEQALVQFEDELVSDTGISQIRLVSLANANRDSSESYRAIFRFISRTLAVLFAAGIVYAVIKIWF